MSWHRVNQIGDLKAFAERCEGRSRTKNVKWFTMVRNEDYTTIASRAAVYTAAILRCKMLAGKIPNPFESAPSQCRPRDGIAEFPFDDVIMQDKRELVNNVLSLFIHPEIFHLQCLTVFSNSSDDRHRQTVRCIGSDIQCHRNFAAIGIEQMRNDFFH